MTAAWVFGLWLGVSVTFAAGWCAHAVTADTRVARRDRDIVELERMLDDSHAALLEKTATNVSLRRFITDHLDETVN